MIWPAEALVQSVIGSLTGAFFPKDLLLDARSQWILTSVLGRTLGFGDSAFSRLPKVLTPVIVRSSRSVPFLLVLREVTKMPERNWSTSLCAHLPCSCSVSSFCPLWSSLEDGTSLLIDSAGWRTDWQAYTLPCYRELERDSENEQLFLQGRALESDVLKYSKKEGLVNSKV